MAIALSALMGKSFNDIYLERPVWALASTGTTGSMQQPVVALYGERNPYNPLSVEYSGNAKSRARSFLDESAQSNYTFYGNTSGPGASSALAPTSGTMGINTIATQTACLANFECFDNGSYGWYSAANADAYSLADRAGVVVGESNWRQMYDLVLTESGALYKDQVGSVYGYVTGANRPSINLALAATLGGSYAPGASWGRGQIAHNRNTGRLLVVQPVSGVNSTSLTFKCHLFDLRLKIGAATSIADIKAAMTDCTAAGSGRYRVFDITLSSAAIFYSTASDYDIANTMFVLCDDDSIWAFKEANSSAGAGQSHNVLWSITHTGDWLTGAYTGTAMLQQSTSTVYGSTNAAQYGPRHMNADDNSVIALYQHNYYYCVGANIAFVSSKAAGANKYNQFAGNANTHFYSIAPTGGPNFAMTRAGTATTINHDGPGAFIAHLDNTVLAATAHNPSFIGHMHPSMNRSTCYGVADIVLKVQPTSEWK